MIAVVVAALAVVQAPEVTGYVRLLGGVQDLGFDAPVLARRSAFGALVGRLMGSLNLDGLRIEVHNRLQGVLRSEAATVGVLGFGISTVPRRAVDLSATLVEGDHGALMHDIDRLLVTVRTPAGDLTVGRQAITWGIATVFPVADVWAQFSPFELDTGHKPGSDAVRLLAYPAPAIELDLVAADHGGARDFAFGARATVTLADADVYVGGARILRAWMGLAGVAAVTGVWKLRGEAVVAATPRATIGVDRIGARVQLSAEYHYNGFGSNDPAHYVPRPQTYFLGRHLAGLFASWLPADRWLATLGTLVHPADGSAALLPAVAWDAGQRYRLIAGGLWSFGARPAFTAPRGLEVQSEFGTYGRFGYVQAAVYF